MFLMIVLFVNCPSILLSWRLDFFFHPYTIYLGDWRQNYSWTFFEPVLKVFGEFGIPQDLSSQRVYLSFSLVSYGWHVSDSAIAHFMDQIISLLITTHLNPCIFSLCRKAWVYEVLTLSICLKSAPLTCVSHFGHLIVLCK